MMGHHSNLNRGAGAENARRARALINGGAMRLDAEEPPPPPPPLPPELEDAVEQSRVAASFIPVDLAPVLAGTFTQPQPTLLRRADDRCLIYRGEINGMHGESGVGKGWVVCFLVGQELRAGHSVIYVDLEDTAASIVARLKAMRVAPERIAAGLIYVRPQDAFTAANVDHLIHLSDERQVSLVVIDSLGEAFGLEGLNENNDVEVGPWLRHVPRRIVDEAASAPAVLIIDHSTKPSNNQGSDAKLYPSGSKRKRAAISGASYLVEVGTHFAKNEGGRLKLKCAKDRHGNFRMGEAVGDLVMKPSTTGAVDLELHLPDERTAGDRTSKIHAVTRAAVQVAKNEARPLTKSSLIRLLSIGSTDDKKDGINRAIALGALSETPGPRNSKLIQYLKELPDDPA